MHEADGMAAITGQRAMHRVDDDAPGDARGGKPLRLLLVDDQPGVLEGLRMRLSLEADLDVVGVAADACTALRLATALVPDVLLLDVAMPGGDGISLIPVLRQRLPHCRVVMLSLHDDRLTRQRAIEAGAAAFVAKHEAHDLLLGALRRC